MNTRNYWLKFVSLLAAGALPFVFAVSSPAQETTKGTGPEAQIKESAARQIQALLDEKEARTPAQMKLNSQLLYAIQAHAQKGEATKGGTSKVLPMRTMIEVDAKGYTLVDIRANVTKDLIKKIHAYGGSVIHHSAGDQTLRARMPLKDLEELAESSDVLHIGPAIKAMTQRVLANPGAVVEPQVLSHLRPGFAIRANHVSAHLAAALPRFKNSKDPKFSKPRAQDTTQGLPAVDTTGVVAHRAHEAQDFFGISGAGVKVGVLSDSVDFLTDVQAAGNLPPDVVVLPGQSGLGQGNTGEGTAILEIVHAMAPGAKLFFATAFTSESSFADNIRALRAAGCDIIVDDIFYFDESPFQDGILAKAVNDVTQSGALYFSSAGNGGNFDDGTSGVWEGDFKDGLTLTALPGGNVHDFGNGVIGNRVLAPGFAIALFWSDPAGGSCNDYDLFVLDNTFSTVLEASTNIQNCTQDPFEIVGPPAGPNEKVVILRNSGAQTRALFVDTLGGLLALATPGENHGHSAAANAMAVAAVDVAEANGGIFIGGQTEPVEVFSSDGPRRIFLKSNGTPYTPGRLLFQHNGGQLRNKPDISAADGVSVSTPGFDPFFGTSAAAPHAAAIAALVKSANRTLSESQIRSVLKSTALDIQAPGFDRDSGAGIANAFDAVLAVDDDPMPFMDLGTVVATSVNTRGDNFIEPGDVGSLQIQLVNNGGATAVKVNATLTSATAGVTITQGVSSYPFIGSAGGSQPNNTPFTFKLAKTARCGLKINFILTVTFDGNTSPRVFTFGLLTGEPGSSSTTKRYTGPVVPIPDADPVGVQVPLKVSGFSSGISNLKFLIGGSKCTADAGATTVGIDHTFVGDLIITLTSPSGTTATIMHRPGGGTFGSSGNNFCQTLFDDSASTSIQAIQGTGTPPLGPPYTGTFQPVSPLAAFDGEDANGTWILTVSDNAGGDTGSVRDFSLILSPFDCAH
jgi:subtilisin-like proprotein convertase family protein